MSRDRAILSLPANLAEQIMASERFASRSHEAGGRREGSHQLKRSEPITASNPAE
ncbi:hypothetical protein [Rhizobium sp. J15]|uniref:hypothetical protein n=1 Tax=Rhizobium sp. J15 TaxID=2035450 RepID=UPI001596BE37|nr:hypothetical protein [Rhizobium sp. J15]